MVNQDSDLLNRFITRTEHGIIIRILVVPNSQDQEFEGVDEWRGCLKIRIKSPAQKGKANRELLEFLSKSLSIPVSDISIRSGETSRLKELEIKGLNGTDILSMLSNR